LSAGTAAGQVYLTGAAGAAPTTPVTVSGDATITSAGVVALASTTISPGSYGSASQIPAYTADAKGRLTAAANLNVGSLNAGSVFTSGTPYLLQD
jgi:hypothetical protein